MRLERKVLRLEEYEAEHRADIGPSLERINKGDLGSREGILNLYPDLVHVATSVKPKDKVILDRGGPEALAVATEFIEKVLGRRDLMQRRK